MKISNMYKTQLLVIVVLVFVSFAVAAQGKTDYWNEFAKTKFEPKYYEKIGEYLFYPNFPAEVRAMEGKEVSIQGFYVPFAPEDGEYHESMFLLWRCRP
jgi:hypothetical protein